MAYLRTYCVEWAALVRVPERKARAVPVPPTDEEQALHSYMFDLAAKSNGLKALDKRQANLEQEVEDLKKKRQKLHWEVLGMLEQLSKLPVADRIDEAVREGMTEPREIVKAVSKDKGGLTPIGLFNLVCYRMQVVGARDSTKVVWSSTDG